MSKLKELAKYLLQHGIGSLSFPIGGQYDYFIEGLGQRITFDCLLDTLYIDTSGHLNLRGMFTELSEEGLLSTFGPNRQIFLQSYDFRDVSNVVLEDKKYLHRVDANDDFTRLLTLPMGAFFSPSLLSDLHDKDKPAVYLLNMDDLRYRFHEYAAEALSPRGHQCLVEASRIRSKATANLNNYEKLVLERSEIELKFEAKRREVCGWAPSRISAIYLMDDSIDSHYNLWSMFPSDGKADPKFLHVRTAGLARMIRVDYRWFEAFCEDEREEYLLNYWRSKPFEPESNTWEYLYEGGLLILGDVPPLDN